MNNMDIYNKYRTVPDTAQRTITGGRLNGMTDINPMWRIQCLTEAFGPCGIGWYTEIVNMWSETGANDEEVAWVQVALYIKNGDEWSRPIAGIGGSMFVTKERNGHRTSDEALKMAYTDALSVCCKMLGIGADVYWSAGRTKYTGPEPKVEEPKVEEPKVEEPKVEEPKVEEPKAEEPKTEDNLMFICECCGNVLTPHIGEKGNEYGVRQISEITQRKYNKTLCWDCACKEGERRKAAGR